MSDNKGAAEPTSTVATDKTSAATPPAAEGAAKNPDPPADNTKQADGKGGTEPGAKSLDKPGDNGGDPADPKANPNPAPEKYELVLKKDSKLLKSDVEDVEAYAKAQGLSKEQAQKLIESKEADHEKFHERQMEAFRSEQTQWRKAAETDTEIAGADGKAFKENVELAHRALAKYADADFRKILNETGLGNNPHLIRTFLRIGKGMADDKAVLDGRSASSGKKPSREQKLYPTHFEKNKE